MGIPPAEGDSLNRAFAELTNLLSLMAVLGSFRYFVIPWEWMHMRAVSQLGLAFIRLASVLALSYSGLGGQSKLPPRVNQSDDGQSGPVLRIIGSGDDLVIGWPDTYWNYRLQYRSDTVDSSEWTDFTDPITIADGWRQVVVKRWSQAGFFRLTQVVGEFTNSIGMKMVSVPAGQFTMGYWQDAPLPDEVVLSVPWWVHYRGEFDEMPPHDVTISQPFWLGALEVSNQEYEQFDPDHALLRGKLDFSKGDNEAVVFVSWDEAKAFCDWLAAREGRPYRLPTEAEWEYACRAGTTTHFSTGDTLPDEYLNNTNSYAYPISGTPSSLDRGQTPPNPWGLFDMHGNVEEWCSDWYGPYEAFPQVDPVGRTNGLTKVARGGSHSTFAFYLRSENRSSMIPEDRNWYIGFRVAMGPPSAEPPLPEVGPQPFQIDVSQTVPPDLTNGPDPEQPYFSGPLQYVNFVGDSYGPLFSSHNHDPGGIVECPNGDLLAVWDNCITEEARDMAVAACRLRYGATNWEPVSLFYDMVDRNDTGPCLWFDGDQTLFYFCGFAPAATGGPLALLMRTSTNNGADWTPPRIIAAEHSVGHQPNGTMLRLASGALIFLCDASPGGNGGTVVWKSVDNGVTWQNLAEGRPAPVFEDGGTGAWIAGIHAQVVQRNDGSLLALGRGDPINDHMPQSVSYDEGTNWTYSASSFPTIGETRRATFRRLKEGALFFASFAEALVVTNATGDTVKTWGLYATVSLDDGATWPYVRLISDDGPGRTVQTLDGVPFTLSYITSEPYGYLSSTQGQNGVIHLISSRQHYRFNLKWLTTPPTFPPPQASASPQARRK